MTPTDTLKRLKSTEGHKTVSRALVYKWHRKFTDGSAEIGSRGRPKSCDNPNIQKVLDVLNADRRYTVREIAEITGYGKSTVQRIIKNDLLMSRVSARWVPRVLTVDEKQTRVKSSRKFVSRCMADDTFLSRIITTDETWVHYYEPESKRQSSIWKHLDSPPPKKAKVVKSLGKVMCIMFMDISGMLLVHMVPSGQTVNANYYSKVSKKK